MPGPCRRDVRLGQDDLVRTDREQNIVLWAWTSHAENRARYEAVQRASVVPVVRLRSPREADRWLADQR